MCAGQSAAPPLARVSRRSRRLFARASHGTSCSVRYFDPKTVLLQSRDQKLGQATQHLDDIPLKVQGSGRLPLGSVGSPGAASHEQNSSETAAALDSSCVAIPPSHQSALQWTLTLVNNSVGLDFQKPIEIDEARHLHNGVDWSDVPEHLAMHCGQIRSIRNLYRKTRGEPLRFFPDNPTFPR